MLWPGNDTMHLEKSAQCLAHVERLSIVVMLAIFIDECAYTAHMM